MTKIKNSEVPLIILGSEDKIRRLENIGFNWKKKGKPDSFEKHFEGLKAYKVKYGRCDATEKSGIDEPLRVWCSKVRQSLTKMKSNEVPLIKGLSEDKMIRLKHIGFDWKKDKQETPCSFEERLEDLKACNAKHGH